jgi:Response regulator containing a CheY-like receiver domain and an HD-GYP domain
MEELHVLLVEDNENDAELILRELKKANGYQILMERVETEDQFKQALHRQLWEVIICDSVMPSFSAARALELIEGYGLTSPFILVSGKISEQDARKILGWKSVHGYISKDKLSDLGPLFRREIRLSSEYDKMLESWAQALGLRDKETQGHSERVTELTIKLARAMSISETQIVHIRRGALMHDVGKMGVPDELLLKAGKLSEEELYVMRKHPKMGYDLLRPMEYLKNSLDIPYCHHEHWDGSGYPRGLKSEEIPLSARIFAVVDTFDAMTNDRPYRAALPIHSVLQYIREQSGKLFDPQVVDVFLEMFEKVET